LDFRQTAIFMLSMLWFSGKCGLHAVYALVFGQARSS
jgi:hypothetical protein